MICVLPFKHLTVKEITFTWWSAMNLTAHWLDRFVASTQFEPTSARAAFPCFDEPAFKSSYSVRIRREGRHIALSNMPKVRQCLLRWTQVSSYVNSLFCTFLPIALVFGFTKHFHYFSNNTSMSTYFGYVQIKTLELPGGLFEDHFDVSVKMSTYLVAYIVSDFQSISKTSEHGIKVRWFPLTNSLHISSLISL